MDSVSATSTASEIQMDYMTLLIAQLQNQNPLEPLDNNEMASQLAQFSQLQQLESMNSSFSEVLNNAQHEYAVSLLGKKVSFVTENDLGVEELTQGTVEHVLSDSDGQIVLVADGRDISLSDVVSITD